MPTLVVLAVAVAENSTFKRTKKRRDIKKCIHTLVYTIHSSMYMFVFMYVYSKANFQILTISVYKQ